MTDWQTKAPGVLDGVAHYASADVDSWPPIGPMMQPLSRKR